MDTGYDLRCDFPSFNDIFILIFVFLSRTGLGFRLYRFGPPRQKSRGKTKTVLTLLLVCSEGFDLVKYIFDFSVDPGSQDSAPTPTVSVDGGRTPVLTVRDLVLLGISGSGPSAASDVGAKPWKRVYDDRKSVLRSGVKVKFSRGMTDGTVGIPIG